MGLSPFLWTHVHATTPDTNPSNSTEIRRISAGPLGDARVQPAAARGARRGQPDAGGRNVALGRQLRPVRPGPHGQMGKWLRLFARVGKPVLASERAHQGARVITHRVCKASQRGERTRRLDNDRSPNGLISAQHPSHGSIIYWPLGGHLSFEAAIVLPVDIITSQHELVGANQSRLLCCLARPTLWALEREIGRRQRVQAQLLGEVLASWRAFGGHDRATRR